MTTRRDRDEGGLETDLADGQDVDGLREFIERAEAGEFGADPGLEATVQIARVLLEDVVDELGGGGPPSDVTF